MSIRSPEAAILLCFINSTHKCSNGNLIIYAHRAFSSKLGVRQMLGKRALLRVRCTGWGLSNPLLTTLFIPVMSWCICFPSSHSPQMRAKKKTIIFTSLLGTFNWNCQGPHTKVTIFLKPILAILDIDYWAAHVSTPHSTAKFRIFITDMFSHTGNRLIFTCWGITIVFFPVLIIKCIPV